VPILNFLFGKVQGIFKSFMSRPIKTFALVLALLLAVLAWLAQPKARKAPYSHQPPPTVSPSHAAAAPAVIPERPAPSPDASLPEVKSGRVIETLTVPDQKTNQSHEITLLQTSFKYPLLRKEQSTSSSNPNQFQPGSLSVFVGDHLLIKLQPGRSESDLKARLPSLNAKIRRRLSDSDHYLVALNNPSIAAFDQLRSALEKSPDLIAYAEPDYIVHHQSTPVFPDDPSFDQQWHLHNTGQTGGSSDADIDAPEAWGVTTGSTSVVIAVIDSGMDLTHPDLTPNLWINPDEIPDNNLDDDNNGYIDDIHGWNFVTNTASPMDDNGHGTHTAGIVGASGNNAIGVSGVSPVVQLMPLKFLSASGSGTNSDAIDAIHYATAKGVFLSSNSWGGSGFSQAMKDAIDAAHTAGIGFIAASGNSGINNDLYPDYPASFTSPNLISVAATDHTDSLVWFSNFGAQSVHLAAGGHQILSTGLGGGTEIMSGTSMAAPQVSGAAALLKAANPSLSFAQIQAMLLATTDPLPSLTNKTRTGGRLNAASALIPATGPQITTLTPIIDDPSPANADGIPSPGESINLLLPIQNIGALATGTLEATLSLPSPIAGITLLQDTTSFGIVPAGTSASHSATPFSIEIANTVSPTDLTLRLTVSTLEDPSQSWTFDHTLEIRSVATVSGTITRITGGTPISNATITLVGPKTFTTSTDSNGLYSLNVTNGTYQITASATGFVPSSPITRTLPPSTSNLNFTLGSSISNISPLSLSATQAKNTTTTQSITLQNTGDTALTYTIQEVPSSDATITSLPPLQLLNAPSNQTPTVLSSAPARFNLPPPGPRGLNASDNTATTLPFEDGFEDGLWGRWWQSWGNGTREVLSGLAPNGNKSFHFHFDGPADHFTGIHQIFPFGTQPGYVSFWTQPGPENEATSYMVLLDLYLVLDNLGLRYEIADFIWFFANSNGRFYINDNVGGNQAVQYAEGQWYHIEFRDINWQAKHFDYWVNNQLIQANIPFRQPENTSGIAYALIYNYSPDTDLGIDAARFLPDELPWLQLSSKSGSIPPGSSTTITATFNASIAASGTHSGSLFIATNAPSQPDTTLPVSLTVTPLPNTPPVTPSDSIAVQPNTPRAITLSASDPDSDPLTLEITRLPALGNLYQTTDGITPGTLLEFTPRVVSDSLRRVIYVPPTNAIGLNYTSFDFRARDSKGATSTGTISIDIVDAPLLFVTPSGSTSSTPLTISLTSSDPTASIHFTTDGSPPSPSSHTVSPGYQLLIDHSISLKAVAQKDTRASPIQTHSFTITDSDADGLPTWWETLHQSVSPNLDPNLDPDSDGVPTMKEFVFGTDPGKPDSLLPTIAAPPPPSLSWPTIPGRVYTLEASPNAQPNAYSPITSPRLGNGQPMQHTDATPTASSRFYRLRVDLP
jgi:subtilisin family serine protease